MSQQSEAHAEAVTAAKLIVRRYAEHVDSTGESFAIVARELNDCALALGFGNADQRADAILRVSAIASALGGKAVG